MIEVAGGIIIAVVVLAFVYELLVNDSLAEQFFDFIKAALGIALLCAFAVAVYVAVEWWGEW